MDMPETKDYFFKQDGKEVYKFATKALPNAVEQACAKIEISPDDLDWIVPHQANIRIIETAAKHLGVSMDKFPVLVLKAFSDFKAREARYFAPFPSAPRKLEYVVSSAVSRTKAAAPSPKSTQEERSV